MFYNSLNYLSRKLGSIKNILSINIKIKCRVKPTFYTRNSFIIFRAFFWSFSFRMRRRCARAHSVRKSRGMSQAIHRRILRSGLAAQEEFLRAFRAPQIFLTPFLKRKSLPTQSRLMRMCMWSFPSRSIRIPRFCRVLPR